MSATSSAGVELFVTGLRNQHAVENQAVSLLSRQVERLENYPEMEARMRQHIDESKAQAQRIKELLAQFGESHSALKDAGLSFMGNMAAMAHTVAADEVIKNTFANYAFEHFESRPTSRCFRSPTLSARAGRPRRSSSRLRKRRPWRSGSMSISARRRSVTCNFPAAVKRLASSSVDGVSAIDAPFRPPLANSGMHAASPHGTVPSH